jgi:hypothetical protein
MKHILKIIVVFLFIHPGYAQTSTAIDFVNKDSAYDFGEIEAGKNAVHKFEYRNISNAPVEITSISSKNKHLIFKWERKALKPGRKDVIVVTYKGYDKDDETGSFENDVLISFKPGGITNAHLYLKGAVVPYISGYTPRSRDTTRSINITIPDRKRTKGTDKEGGNQ